MCRFGIQCVGNCRLNDVFYTLPEALEGARKYLAQYGMSVEISLWQIGGWRTIGLLNCE